MAAPNGVSSHFAEKDPSVLATYEAILGYARSLGPVKVESKKTSIHLVRTTAFAGVATRKSWLILTLKAAADLKSPRITKHEQASTNRWHLEIKLESAAAVDRECKDWLSAAYRLAGT